MLLRALYRMGLTNLTRDEVDQYEMEIGQDERIEENRKIQRWGLFSLSLCALLAASALGTAFMLSNLYTVSDLQAKTSVIRQAAASEPVELTRGAGHGDETDPAQILQRVRKRTQEINDELSALRLKSIDYSSLAEQRKRLAVLNRELRQLSTETALARKRLGAEL
jgi:hypothetical protein